MSRTNLRSRAARRRGFTLVEVLISSTIAAGILAAILSTFLMLGRSGYNAANYSMMESEARRALEMFSQEARMANNIEWVDANTITLRVVNSGSSTTQVTYAYDPDTTPGNRTARCFYRVVGNTSTAPDQRLILVRNVSEFAFRRYKIVNGVDYTATNDTETKQIQITLRSIRTGATTVDATNAVLSARVVLRNKPVST